MTTAAYSPCSQPGGHCPALAADGDLGTFWLARISAGQCLALTRDNPAQVTAVQVRGFQGTIQRSFLQVLAAGGKASVELSRTSYPPQFPGNRPADCFFPREITTPGVRCFTTATHSTSDSPDLGEILVFDSAPFAP